MIETLQSIRLPEVVDLVVVWLMVWAGIAWLRGARARLALAGLGILVAVYLVARQLGLVLTTWILQGFAAVAVLVAVVVFQQDLRRLFEQIAALGLRRRVLAVGPDAIGMLAMAMANLAQHRYGALVVLPGLQPLDAHVDGGLPLDARISEPLLLSLFDPHSPGHDGAVIIEGDRAVQFGVHLPLSTDHEQLGPRGTRHAAALGLAERTDALCIAVSEERGTVSVAKNGRLRTLQMPQEIAGEIRGFFLRLAPSSPAKRGRFDRMLKQWREGLLALPIAALLWLLAIPGGTIVELERMVPVTVSGVPQAYELESVDPERVQVTLSGRRRDIYFLGPDALQVRVDAILVDLGRRSFSLTPANVYHPERVEVRAIEPDGVRISLKQREAESARSGEGGETGAQ